MICIQSDQDRLHILADRGEKRIFGSGNREIGPAGPFENLPHMLGIPVMAVKYPGHRDQLPMIPPRRAGKTGLVLNPSRFCQQVFFSAAGRHRGPFFPKVLVPTLLVDPPLPFKT